MNITNEIITAYIDTLYRCPNEKLTELRAFAEEHRVPIILKDTEGLLLNLLRIKGTENLLEIGTAIGYSACSFANGCGCQVTSIEADSRAFALAESNVRNLGFSEQVEILHGDAREVLANLKDEKGEDFTPFDTVFIDAAKSHYRAFWDLILPLCAADALIICDNVLMKGMTASDEYDPGKKYKTSIRKMREFLDYITSLEDADTCILPVGDGVSLSVLKRK